MIWLEWFIWISWWFFRMMNDKIKSSQIMMQLNLWHSCFEMARKQLQFIIWVSDKLYSAYNRFRSYSILETFISILCPFFRKVLYFDAIVTPRFWHISNVHFLIFNFNTFQISVFPVFFTSKILCRVFNLKIKAQFCGFFCANFDLLKPRETKSE